MRVLNRNVHREYELLEKLEAGMVLIGAEVKSVKQGNIKLEGSYVKIRDGEVYLVGAGIPVYKYARPEGYDSNKTRKLLLNRKEILRLQTKMNSAAYLTIVPVSCYNKKGILKLEVALAKGKKQWQRKRFEKDKTEKRRVQKELKEYKNR